MKTEMLRAYGSYYLLINHIITGTCITKIDCYIDRNHLMLHK